MLSLFPELLYLAPFSAFIIRITIGFMFALSAYRHVFIPTPIMRALGVIEGISAVLLFVGGYTQAAALVGFVTIAFTLYVSEYRTFPRSTLALLLIMCLSLLVTGAGPFAFDLPL